MKEKFQPMWYQMKVRDLLPRKVDGHRVEYISTNARDDYIGYSYEWHYWDDDVRITRLDLEELIIRLQSTLSEPTCGEKQTIFKVVKNRIKKWLGL